MTTALAPTEAPAAPTPLFLSFADITPAHAALVGGKALSLGALASAGFPVPEGFCLTTEAFERHLERCGLAEALEAVRQRLAEAAPEEGWLEQARSTLLAAPLPDAVRQVLSAACATHFSPSTPLAVRSSGTMEDLEGASFAGQYESILNVRGLEALEASVKRCWASLLTSRVVAYLRERGGRAERWSMAVAVQRLVPADVSGVLFTVHPVSGREEEALIEAVFGLGESLVGGKVNADRFVVHVPEPRVVERTLAHKALQVVPSEAGQTEERALSDDEARRSTLTDPQLLELAELAGALQEHAGRPVDVEWLYHRGKLYVVQSRPITRIDFGGIRGEWTTADFKDGGVSSDVCSNFMYSLYELAFDTSMPRYLKRIKLLDPEDGQKWIRMFFARPYWSMGGVKSVLESLPGWHERNFDLDLGIEPPYEGPGSTTPFTALGVLRALPVLFALEADYEERLRQDAQFVATWEQTKRPFERSADELRALGAETFAHRYGELINRFYFETETSYFETIYNTSNSKLDFKVHFEKANRAVGGDLSYLKLVSGLKNLSHMRPMVDLHQRLLRLKKLGQRVDERFVRDYAWTWRHHSRRELDIRVPRWADDLEHVRQLLQDAEASFRPEDDPREREQRQHAEYLAERTRAERALSFLARRAFSQKLERVRQYAWWREEMRDHSSYAYHLVRLWTVEAARRLVQRGMLERAEDIWHLRYQQVHAALSGALGAAEARRQVRAGERQVRSFRHFKNPNEIGDRYRMRTQGPPLSHGALKGTGCSPGRVTATARVVAELSDAHRVQSGEVLVTRFTDPGWTPLFARLAGVVTETGGLLSHAAVISREYGIPAVLAVQNATQLIRDGDTVLVDGGQGAVEVVQPMP